jgi:hypothetical protein
MVIHPPIERKGDPYLDSDPALGVKQPLISDFSIGPDGESEQVHYTFVLQPLN